MSYLVAGTAAFFLAVTQASALPYWRILGVTPDVVLIFVACWAMLRGQREAMLVVPVAAFLRDLVTSDPLGTSLLALAPIVPLATLRDFKVVETDFLPTLAVVVLGSLAYGLISMTVLAATGQEVPWLMALRVAIVPSLVVNALVTPVIYLPIRGFVALQRSTAAGVGPSFQS
jgi:rod shape-determining protein MreD